MSLRSTKLFKTARQLTRELQLLNQLIIFIKWDIHILRVLIIFIQWWRYTGGLSHLTEQVFPSPPNQFIVLFSRDSLVLWCMLFQLQVNLDEFVYKRFYLSLMLLEMISRKTVWEVAARFSVSRGFLQNLLMLTLSFTSSLIRFTEVSWYFNESINFETKFGNKWKNYFFQTR